jgi:uncharacterized damage-inducible protein DinB
MKKSMRCLLLFAIVCTVFGFGTNPTVAQQAAKKAGRPTPPDTPSEAVLDAWNTIGGKLIDMAEDFPEDKYDFRASSEVRTFAEVLLHIVGTSYIFTDQIQGKPPRPHDLSRKDYPTKAHIVAALRKAFRDGADAIKAKGDSGMSKAVYVAFSNGMVRVYDLAYGSTMHASEHYGQLVVYFRLNGIVPPETRKNTPQGND